MVSLAPGVARGEPVPQMAPPLSPPHSVMDVGEQGEDDGE